MNKNLAKAIKNHSAGRLGEAEALYRKVLRDEPDNAVVLVNLAVMANQVGKTQLSIELSQQALKADPRSSTAYNTLGNCFSALGRSADAIQCYRSALGCKANYPEALHNLGLEFNKTGQLRDAFMALQEGIRLRPDFPEAYNSLGLVLMAQGKLQEAVDSYKTALKINPKYIVACNNLGNAYATAQQPAEAVKWYREALRLNPRYFEALNNMGNALAQLDRIDEAIAAFKAAVAINPKLAEARTSLAVWRQCACDWNDAKADDEAFMQCARSKPGAIDPFFILSQNSSHADQLHVAQHYAAARSATNPEETFSHTPDGQKRKIRIGYISGNFSQHPNSLLSVGLFERHDRERFEVFGYSYGKDDKSAIRKRVEKSFDHFADLQAMTHAQAAKRVHDDKIDILIDRQGYTTGHRLGIFAHRPAPVQVNYLGYPGTMGSPALDYVIADPYVLPMDQQEFFMEKIVHLPDCYQSTDDKAEISEKPLTRADCGLTEKGFVFACFNNTNKIRPQFFDIWMRLLSGVPGSVLWLLNKNKLVKANLEAEAKKRGIDPGRIICAPSVSHPEHLARQKLADLFLDTLPYNAHTTASDALWAGLPVLTCAGDTFAGRVAGSVLNAIGLPEMITTSLKDYENTALALARDPKALERIRQKIQKNRGTTPLFNTERYTRNLEAAYERMFALWQSGKPPEPIAVAKD